MNTHIHSGRSPIALAALGGIAVTAASVVVEIAPGQDVSFPLFMLGGPVLTGGILAGRGHRWQPGAAAWSLAALIWLVVDWAMNHEDVAFHAVVSVVFAALVALGAGLVRVARRLRARATRRAAA
jgi:hypothetical protein